MIGGNVTGIIQKKDGFIINEIGEKVQNWRNEDELTGWLDLSGGDSKYTIYNTKIQESTHVFICDYKNINYNAEECHMRINDRLYDILLIDNPMELNQQLEIYLKFVGGQDGGTV